jgi:hypothetical protein
VATPLPTPSQPAHSEKLSTEPKVAKLAKTLKEMDVDEDFMKEMEALAV